MISSYKNKGVTLFELIVSLALSGVLFALITDMISTHFGVLQRERGRVEEVQLARALLSQISNDIKSAVQYNGVDVSAALDNISVDDALGAAMSAGVDSSALLDAASGLLSSGDQMPTYDFQTSFPESSVCMVIPLYCGWMLVAFQGRKNTVPFTIRQILRRYRMSPRT